MDYQGQLGIVSIAWLSWSLNYHPSMVYKSGKGAGLFSSEMCLKEANQQRNLDDTPDYHLSMTLYFTEN